MAESFVSRVVGATTCVAGMLTPVIRLLDAPESGEHAAKQHRSGAGALRQRSTRCCINGAEIAACSFERRLALGGPLSQRGVPVQGRAQRVQPGCGG